MVVDSHKKSFAGDDGTLIVLVFRPDADEASGYQPPVFSNITSDRCGMPIAPFTKPILAGQAISSFLDPAETVDAAILMAFDNYGIVGRRLLKPKSSSVTLEYKIDGQLPEISGLVMLLFGDGDVAVWLFIDF
jgi:hypothetical protein